MIKKLTKNFGKKIIVCPACRQKLRIPIRVGKTLRITCSNCQVNFDISFQHPFENLFKWYKGQSLGYKMKSFFSSLHTLSLRSKLLLGILFVIVFSILLNILGPTHRLDNLIPIKAQDSPNNEII